MKEKALWNPIERLNYADAFIRVDQKPIDLDFWQETFLQDTHKYSITLKSRRTGFSFITGLKGLVKAMDPARFKYVRQFVSYNEDDAKEKINYVKEFYHSIPAKYKYKKPIASETKTAMEFYDKGGKTVSRLISIACRPPRGRGGDIVFDEMGIYPQNKARTVYTAGLPVIARGGCVEIGSTPLGKLGMFYDIFAQTKTYPEYTRFTIPWWFAKEMCNNVEEAVKLAPYMETEERVAVFGTDAIKTIFNSMILEDFQQEFECNFIDSALSFITLDLLYANTPGMREWERTGELEVGQDEEELEINIFRTVDELLLGYNPEKHGRLFIGYDVARRRDAAVIFVIGQLPNGKKISVAEIEMINKKFEYQRDQIRKIMKCLPVVRGCIDQTGQGEDTTETLQGEFGETKIEGVIFNTESKEDLAIEARTGLEQHEFLLHNDDKFRRQAHSIKRIPTIGGHFRYDSQRDENGHADSFWAWALANHAVTKIYNITGFYGEWHKKRNGGDQTLTENVTLATPIIQKRGKSAARIMREMQKNNGGII